MGGKKKQHVYRTSESFFFNSLGRFNGFLKKKNLKISSICVCLFRKVLWYSNKSRKKIKICCVLSYKLVDIDPGDQLGKIDLLGDFCKVCLMNINLFGILREFFSGFFGKLMNYVRGRGLRRGTGQLSVACVEWGFWNLIVNFSKWVEEENRIINVSYNLIFL